MISPYLHPEWISAISWALATTLLALLVASAVAEWRRRALLGRFDREAMQRGLTQDALLWGALALIALAAVGPRWLEREVPIDSHGIDVVLLFDLSLSMDARDNPPSRLHRARRGAAKLLARLQPGDRAALAGFAGRGVLFTPLTSDLGTIAGMVSGLDTSLIGEGGSALASGLLAASRAFDEASDRPRAVLLLGDGEVDDAPTRAVLESLDAGSSSLHALLFGTADGGEIATNAGPLSDATGAAVLSKREPERITPWVTPLRGRSWLADEWGEVDVAEVVTELRSPLDMSTLASRGSSGASSLRTRKVVAITPIALAAFVLLVADLSGLRPKRSWIALRRQLARARHRSARPVAGVAVALCAVLPLQSESDELRADPIARFEATALLRELSATESLELGLARARVGEIEAATAAFWAAALQAERREVATAAYYDLGVLAVDAGHVDAAAARFFDALALSPRDRAAQEALRWLALREEKANESRESPEMQRTSEDESDEAPDETDDQRKAAPTSSEQQRQRRMPELLTREEVDARLARIRDDPQRALRAASQTSDAARQARASEAILW